MAQEVIFMLSIAPINNFNKLMSNDKLNNIYKDVLPVNIFVRKMGYINGKLILRIETTDSYTDINIENNKTIIKEVKNGSSMKVHTIDESKNESQSLILEKRENSLRFINEEKFYDPSNTNVIWISSTICEYSLEKIHDILNELECDIDIDSLPIDALYKATDFIDESAIVTDKEPDMYHVFTGYTNGSMNKLLPEEKRKYPFHIYDDKTDLSKEFCEIAELNNFTTLTELYNLFIRDYLKPQRKYITLRRRNINGISHD